MTIDVTLDASDLLGGIYTSEIVITTNDPVNETIVVPVTFTVVGIPQIVVSDTGFDFGSLILGNEPLTETFTIENTGTGVLDITSIAADLSAYTVSVSNAILGPGDDLEVTITFDPTAIQTYNGSITIQTNAGTQIISVSGVGQGAPIAAATPLLIEETLLAGETRHQSRNTFQYRVPDPLNFTVEGATTPQVAIYGLGLNQFQITNFQQLLNQLDNALPNYELDTITSTDPDEVAKHLGIGGLVNHSATTRFPRAAFCHDLAWHPPSKTM